jgi:hypothetical protein
MLYNIGPGFYKILFFELSNRSSTVVSSRLIILRFWVRVQPLSLAAGNYKKVSELVERLTNDPSPKVKFKTQNII